MYRGGQFYRITSQGSGDTIVVLLHGTLYHEFIALLNVMDDMLSTLVKKFVNNTGAVRLYKTVW